MGWGVLQPLIDNKEVTDIHVYDYQTVVLQRGKVSENTGLHWPTNSSYVTFLDRLLLRLGKSLSTQQHTVDAALPNGIRVCAVHESVCGQRGPSSLYSCSASKRRELSKTSCDLSSCSATDCKLSRCTRSFWYGNDDDRW